MLLSLKTNLKMNNLIIRNLSQLASIKNQSAKTIREYLLKALTLEPEMIVENLINKQNKYKKTYKRHK